MDVQFAVLASGSRGNSTLIRTRHAAHLVDLGLGAKALADRLASVGCSVRELACVFLTHTHGDHVDPHALNALAEHRVVFFCHEDHRPELDSLNGFRRLEELGLVRHYGESPFLAPTGLRVEPIALRHDGPTFGFRLEAHCGKGARPVSLGYVADTGSWSDAVVEALTDVDVLGVEFNHDVQLQRLSRRHPALIERNLGDHGHLSNEQGAELVGAVLARSARGSPRHLVLLHLSDQCNRAELALKAARGAIRQAGSRVVVHAALQTLAHPDLRIRPMRRRLAPVS